MQLQAITFVLAGVTFLLERNRGPSHLLVQRARFRMANPVVRLEFRV